VGIVMVAGRRATLDEFNRTVAAAGTISEATFPERLCQFVTRKKRPGSSHTNAVASPRFVVSKSIPSGTTAIEYSSIEITAAMR